MRGPDATRMLNILFWFSESAKANVDFFDVQIQDEWKGRVKLTILNDFGQGYSPQ